MAVTAKDLREYLNLPPDTLVVTGGTSDGTAFPDSGTYTFIKTEDGWTLNGSAVSLSNYGITPGGGNEIVVDYLTYNTDRYLAAAKSKAKTAGVPELQDNAQYDLFILALASMYYDNRGMAFSGSYQQAAEENARRMINSFVLELRYADG